MDGHDRITRYSLEGVRRDVVVDALEQAKQLGELIEDPKELLVAQIAIFVQAYQTLERVETPPLPLASFLPDLKSTGLTEEMVV